MAIVVVAAATAALITLAVGGCGASDEPVEVTGMIGAYEDIASGEDLGEVFTEGPCEGWQDWEGNVHGQTWSYGEDAGVSWVSDERVAGELEFTMDADVRDEGDTCVLYFTGTETITNDNGTWEGTWEGTSTFGEGAGDDQHLHDVTFTLLGTGDYDGLEFVFNMQGIDLPWPLKGTISPV